MAEGNQQRLPSGPEELMLRILNGMVDRYLDLRQPLADQLEYWQQQLLSPRKPFRDWMLLLDARAWAGPYYEPVGRWQSVNGYARVLLERR